MTNQDNDYLLGTHDEELERLGLQHRVWRPRVLDAWRRAGITVGSNVLDVGCGPGYASIDLAEIVGPSGRVVAVDRSQRFLDRLRQAQNQRSFPRIESHEIDLDTGTLPEVPVDAAWCRWVLAFLKDPQRLVEQLANVIRPDGTLVIYEYFAYELWRFLPPLEELTEFVDLVSRSWRADGGEPNIALQLPGMLTAAGFEIVETRPLVEVATPRDYIWQWPKSFLRIGTDRLIDLGLVTRERGEQIVEAFAKSETLPDAMMITPGVLEIIARRR